jgi:putative endonuclease
MSWHVYMVRCSDNTLYTGVARDLERRIQQHNHGSEGAKYTRARRPVTLVYNEPAEDRSAAQQREYQIRKLSAAQKRMLIAGQ